MCLDLQGQQYSEEELLEHYCELDNRSILRNQKLSADFCVRYLLDCAEWGIQLCFEEAWIHDVDVLRYQPHLTQEDLREARRRLEPERLAFLALEEKAQDEKAQEQKAQDEKAQGPSEIQ